MNGRPTLSPTSLLQEADRWLQERDLSGALAGFDAAEQEGADADRCSAGRWMASMLVGDYEAAWRESDAIRRRGRPDPHRFWNGERLDGKRVMVRCLHGFGDALQMLAYAPRLRERAARVIVEVNPRMVPLARCLEGIDEVITWGEDAPLTPPDWDVQIEVMELPYLFRTVLDDLPIRTGRLHLPDALLHQAAAAMGPANGKMRVGVVWEAGEWNRERSIPLRLLTPLLTQEKLEIWSLQGGAAAYESAGTGMVDARAICGDGLIALAATIANLDLVITVDTLAAHLAGALGKPAWVMLQHAADWRWMHGREDSPWYPSLRLLRPGRPGDWQGVVDEVSGALEEVVQLRGAG
jgi:hypothetical protein